MNLLNKELLWIFFYIDVLMIEFFGDFDNNMKFLLCIFRWLNFFKEF